MGLISLVYNSQLGKYGGNNAISVYAVVASIMTFVIMPASGISQGIQPIVGNNYGAGLYRRVLSTLYQASALSVGITCIIWLIVLFFPRQILMAFGATPEMLATTFFRSLAKPIPSIVITFLRQILFLIPFIYLFPLAWGINGIFVAQPVSDALALVVSAALVLREQHLLCGGTK